MNEEYKPWLGKRYTFEVMRMRGIDLLKISDALVADWEEYQKSKEPSCLIEKVTRQIRENHHKILDDFCKAYMAELYAKGIKVNPGDLVLNEQLPTMDKEKDCLVTKYWFAPAKPGFIEEKEDLVNNEFLKNILFDFLRDVSTEFQGRLDEGNISLREINDFIAGWVENDE